MNPIIRVSIISRIVFCPDFYTYIIWDDFLAEKVVCAGKGSLVFVRLGLLFYSDVMYRIVPINFYR